MKVFRFICLIAMLYLLTACSEEEEVISPKPRGYFRIHFPEKTYVQYDSLCPYSFEIPAYSHLVPNRSNGAEPCWQNLEFNAFKATLYLSYKAIDHNLDKYLEDAHEIANRHQIKASGLDQIAIVKDSAKVYGLLFNISGNTASSVQFYLTDSTRHFLRGSLYFNCSPNSDSLELVIDFLRQDILHLIQTTRWKDIRQKSF